MTRRDGGKGDAPRPLGVSMEEFDKNFDAIFGKKEKKPEVQIEVDAEQGEVGVAITKTWEI